MNKISSNMKDALSIMRRAVDEMLVTRAKTGNKVIVCNAQGRPSRVAASYLLKRRDKRACFAK